MSFQNFLSTTYTGSPSLLTSEQLATMHANYHGRNDADDSDRQAVAPMIAASAGDSVDAERRRLEQIQAACRGDWQDHDEEVSELQATAIAGEMSVDGLIDSLRHIRRNIFESRIPMAHTVSGGSRQNHPEVITAALCLAGGLSEPEKHFSEQVLDVADRASRGMSLQTLLMEAACNSGYKSRPGEHVSDGNLRQVLQAVFTPGVKAAGFSTLDIANVLSNTANKFLLDGFTEVEDPWREIAAVKSVRNFKEHTFVRLLDSLEFEELGKGGEIKHGTLADDTMTVTAATYAKMLAITRTDIINDDLGALTDAPRRLGRAAMMKFRRLFWTAFLASDSFFDAANNNVVTGSGTALDVEGTGMTAALKAFRSQKSPSADGAKLIGGRPAVLLVPPALEVPARRLLTSSGIVSGTDGMVPNGNPFAGMATLVVADWIGTDADLSGASDSQWYLLRAPAFAPAMLVAALNGRVEPTVETTEADFHTLGIQMRGYNDVGFGRGEKLCGLQMAGTT